MRKISLARYNAGKRYYISISTENCFGWKTRVEELRNDLANKSLSKGVLLYVNKNHFFNSFKKLLAFISFIVVIY